MARRARGWLLAVAVVAGTVLAAPAGAAAGLVVRVTVDQPVVAVDLTGSSPRVVLSYDVVVENPGGAVADDVVVEPRLPGELRRADGGAALAAGDVPPGGSWWGRFSATVDPALSGAVEVEPWVEARTADGLAAASAPAPTKVQVISAATYQRGDPRVLGATFARGGTELARTGSPLVPLTVAGGALVLAGSVLRRRASG